MGRKRQGNQLKLAFMEDDRGKASTADMEGLELPMAASVPESPTTGEQLMEVICDRDNLKQALKRVVANKGSPGVDGMTVNKLPGYLRQHWPALRQQLLQGTYSPQPVKRVEIPKPGGGVRKLGIPTVLDRFIQQAVLQVLQRRWDPTFSQYSFGFRPGRSAHQAVAAAQQYVVDGYKIVVDIDLKRFFDRVNHDKLMSLVARREHDKRLLRLIRAFLNAGVMENGLTRPPTEGTPQGGPLSPLLSNLMLNELDRELEQRGHRFVRYADDCNVYVRSKRAGHRVMQSLNHFIVRKLKLQVNQEKSAVDRPSRRAFLGFSFTRNRPIRRRIADSKRVAFRRRVREITHRHSGKSFATTVRQLASYIRGWRSYYGFCETPSVLSDLDGWTRRRLRSLLWTQWRTARRRQQELRRLGVLDPHLVWCTGVASYGPWHMSRSKALCFAMPAAYFDSVGVPRLTARGRA